MHERVERVFAFIEELIGELPVPSSHRELLRLHVEVSREQAEVYPERPAVQLPLLVHAAIAGDERPALPIAGACTLLYLGADLFDNVIDHELPPAGTPVTQRRRAWRPPPFWQRFLSLPSPACENKERHRHGSGRWPTSLRRPC